MPQIEGRPLHACPTKASDRVMWSVYAGMDESAVRRTAGKCSDILKYGMWNILPIKRRHMTASRVADALPPKDLVMWTVEAKTDAVQDVDVTLPKDCVIVAAEPHGEEEWRSAEAEPPQDVHLLLHLHHDCRVLRNVFLDLANSKSLASKEEPRASFLISSSSIRSLHSPLSSPHSRASSAWSQSCSVP